MSRFQRKLWRDLFTGRDNKTYDLGRFLWALTVCSFLLIAFFYVWKGQTLDMSAFGTGCAALLFGGGVGVAVKFATEPQDKPEDP